MILVILSIRLFTEVNVMGDNVKEACLKHVLPAKTAHCHTPGSVVSSPFSQGMLVHFSLAPRG